MGRFNRTAITPTSTGNSAWAAAERVVDRLSPSTAERDRGLKKEFYGRQEVREYWIVDPDGDAVNVWTFGDDDEAIRHERFTDRLPVRIGAETLGEIDPVAVFRRG